MKKLILIGVLSLFAIGLFAQNWTKIGSSSLNFPNGKPDTVTIEKLCAKNQTTLYAFGEKTLILTEDAGVTWKNANFNFPFTPYAVHFFDQNLGYIVGDSIEYSNGFAEAWGLMFRTIDGGKNWSRINTITGIPYVIGIEQFSFADSLNFCISGAYNKIYRTNDGAKTWQTITTPGSGPQFGILNMYNDSNYFVITDVSSHGYFTKDGGKNWLDTNFFDNNRLTNLYMQKMYFTHSNKLGFMLDQYGTPHITNSGGEIWGDGLNPGPGYLTRNSVYSFIDDVNGWVVSEGNKVYHLKPNAQSLLTFQLDTIGLNNDSISATSRSAICAASPSLAYLVNKVSANTYNIYRYGTASTGNNTVSGKVFVDMNNNNVFDSGIDFPLANSTLQLEPGSYFTSTDNNGNYSFQAGIGTFTITNFKPAGDAIMKFGTPASSMLNVNFIDSGNVSGNNHFILKPVNFHPRLEISIGSNMRRICRRSFTTVHYYNNAFRPAQNSTVTVKLPTEVVLVKASETYTVDGNGNYVFNIGTVPPFSSGTIIITDSVRCKNLMGRTVCTEAYIDCDSSNYKTDTVYWDKSEVKAGVDCLSGWVSFRLINSTAFGMNDSSKIRLFSNAQLFETRKYKLDANDTLDITFEGDSTTFRIEADQTQGHPLSLYTQATIEGCMTEGQGTASTGFVNKLPVNDFNLKKSVDCQTIKASYDPNDKTVYPEGAGANNDVKRGTPLIYRIRFQNTGNDTAFKVVVRDSLPNNLDIATLRIGAASHSYTYKITGKANAVLEVTFDNILLPDSTTDELGSHGFFYFNIQHKKGLPINTEIKNEAGIYFDFNAPVITNTAKITLNDGNQLITKTPNWGDNLPFVVKSYTKDTLCIGDTFKVLLIGNGPFNWYDITNPTISLGSTAEIQLIAQASTSYVGAGKDGTDTLTVLVKNCSSSIGIEDIKEPQMKVYPNPSSDGIFTLQSSSEIVSFAVVDITGRLVLSANGTTNVDLSNEKLGLYFLLVETADNKMTYFRLMKQ